MKRTLSIMLLTAMLAVLSALSMGCNDGMVTPTPRVSASPRTTTQPTGSAGGENGNIEGFVEGQMVDKTQVPEVVQAITAEVPNASISSITFATYMGKQMYHVILSSTGNGDSKEYYVTADGTLIPADASTSASPSTGSESPSTTGGSGSGSGSGASSPSAGTSPSQNGK